MNWVFSNEKKNPQLFYKCWLCKNKCKFVKNDLKIIYACTKCDFKYIDYKNESLSRIECDKDVHLIYKSIKHKSKYDALISSENVMQFNEPIEAINYIHKMYENSIFA